MLNIFINDLDNETQSNFSRLGDDTELRGVADTPGGCTTIQKDLSRLDKWANRDLVKFKKMKCEVLPLERDNPMHQHRLVLLW